MSPAKPTDGVSVISDNTVVLSDELKCRIVDFVREQAAKKGVVEFGHHTGLEELEKMLRERKDRHAKIVDLWEKIKDSCNQHGLNATTSSDSLVTSFRELKRKSWKNIVSVEGSIARLKLESVIKNPKDPFAGPILFKGQELYAFSSEDAKKWSKEEVEELLKLLRAYVIFRTTRKRTPVPRAKAAEISAGIYNVLGAVSNEGLADDSKSLLHITKEKFRSWHKHCKWINPSK